jgi:hypothetical protein
MTDTSRPQIAALVDVLSAHDPAELSRLRHQYKGAANMLAEGTTMGGAEHPSDTQSSEIQPAHVDTALTVLKVVRARIRPNLDYARQRLARVKTLRLTGSLITAVTATGVLAAIFSNWPNELKASAAIVNLGGSACALIAGYLEGRSYGDNRSIADLYENLIKAAVEAESLIDALELDLRLGSLTQDVKDRVVRANAAAAELRWAEFRLGTPARRLVQPQDNPKKVQYVH